MMLVKLVLFVVVSLVTTQDARSANCYINIKDPSLNRAQPLILRSDTQLVQAPRNGFGFYLPDVTGIVEIPHRATVRLACPGPSNYFDIFRQPGQGGRKVKHVIANCIGGTNFSIENQQRQYTEMFCNQNPNHVAKLSVEKCGEPAIGFKIHIGFEVERDLFVLMENCFDQNNLKTLYSKYDLVKGIKGKVSLGKNRPRDFSEIPGYSKNIGLDMKTLYNRDKQRIAFNEILHVPESEPDKYISERCFLNRGHLTAAGDFVYISQKRATFYYINVAPQWNTVNSGNWGKLEESLQEMASASELNLQVYTGTHGVMTLESIEIFLSYVTNRNVRRHPVPDVFWKVVYDPKSKRGVAIVTLNNPHVKFDYKTFLKRYSSYCNLPCEKIVWFKNWSRNDNKGGLTCCSDVKHFRGIVKSLPPFVVNDLLDCSAKPYYSTLIGSNSY